MSALEELKAKKNINWINYLINTSQKNYSIMNFTRYV